MMRVEPTKQGLNFIQGTELVVELQGFWNLRNKKLGTSWHCLL